MEKGREDGVRGVRDFPGGMLQRRHRAKVATEGCHREEGGSGVLVREHLPGSSQD